MKGKTLLAAATVAAAGWAAPTASAEVIYGLTEANTIKLIDSNAPAGQPLNAVGVTGLGGDSLQAIDVRPATLQLYGLGASGQLYRINTVSGAATAIGSPLALTGTAIDMDFNPNVDRLRVVSNDEQNLRVRISNQNTVTVTNDTNLTPAGNVTGAAYTRNAPLPDSTTTLFDIDTGTDKLVKQDPPNNGTLTDVGALGVDLVGDAGFDISTASTPGTGAVGADSAFLLGRISATEDVLYSVNLTTGAATSLGAVGGDVVRDIAVAPPVPQLAVLYSTTGIGGTTQSIVTVRADEPQTVGTTVNVSGLQSGETLVGIDRRPAGGAVYGVGSTSRVYTISLATGAATPVVPGPFTPVLNGASFGLDFNPVPDAIRIVSDTEQNLRVNPTTGAATQDAALTPAGEVTGAAYTNPVSPAPAATTLFYLDTGSDELKTTADPNTGVLTVVGPLGQDFTAGNGYDIVARFNQGFAALDPMGLAGTPNLYAVNSFSPPAPDTARTELIGSLGGFGNPLTMSVAGATVINDNVVPTPTATATPTATSTATVSPTPTATTGPPVSTKGTPKLTATVKPKRDKTAPFEVRVKGKVKPPAGTARGLACKGKVKITITRKGKKLGGGKAPVAKSCAFTIKRTLNSKAGKKGTAKVAIRFGGNTVLKPKAITKSFAYGS